MSHAEGEPFKQSIEEIAVSDPNIAAIDQNYPNKYCIKCSSIIPKASKYCSECGAKQFTKIVDITHIINPNNNHIISSSQPQQPIIIRPIHPTPHNGNDLKCSDWRCHRNAELQCQKCRKCLCSIHARIIKSGDEINIFCKKCGKRYLRSQCGRTTLSVIGLVFAILIIIIFVL